MYQKYHDNTPYKQKKTVHYMLIVLNLTNIPENNVIKLSSNTVLYKLRLS